MTETITQALRQTFLKYYPLGDADIALIEQSGELKTYEKSVTIIQGGRYNAYEYFLLDGIAHRYNSDPSHKAVTTGIYRDHEVITPHFARTRNNQSIFSLQAISACSFFQVPIGAFDSLRMNYAGIRDFGQSVVESEFKSHLHFEVLFRTYSAKDRLEYFREHFPLLENLIPHTIIASFLGITPVSFSRLRNELSRK